MSVDPQKLLEAFLFSHKSGRDDRYAVIDKRSGRLYLITGDFEDSHEFPEDYYSSDYYLVIPDRDELHVGKQLILSFASNFLSEKIHSEIEKFYYSPHPFEKFRDILTREGLTDRWLSFELSEELRALKDWCLKNNIPLMK